MEDKEAFSSLFEQGYTHKQTYSLLYLEVARNGMVGKNHGAAKRIKWLKKSCLGLLHQHTNMNGLLLPFFGATFSKSCF